MSDSTTILDILCSHYFFVDERPRLKICLILESNQLNLTILGGTLPITPVYSHSRLHAVFSLIFSFDSTWISPVLFYIYPLLPCIVFVFPYIPVPIYSLVSSLYSHITPYLFKYTLYSLVSSLYSHTSRTLLNIPSTPLYRLWSPVYRCTLLRSFKYTLYSLVSPLYSHITPYPFKYTLNSRISPLYSHITP